MVLPSPMRIAILGYRPDHFYSTVIIGYGCCLHEKLKFGQEKKVKTHFACCSSHFLLLFFFTPKGKETEPELK
ncbi:unnamed protein product [Orchesella dallaii]|uniref:Uncharacterized protein n=1 Tax=Orchesella dallaii TaxID=48710 RepID=A0ABP1QS80_9HEXA